ncbi:MAG: aminotransferase class I/II-fold pyridoxal phosphate-dependent enzyme [Alphaproteobacteria bacterium]|nr:aminotransferase class I/II-fold pyridoxal phosphate-dependent enzyme [Alphaproteobacteria bacterium]
MNQYAVYFVTNWTNEVLYTGFTNNLARRTLEHKFKTVKGFTYKYNVKKLVYYELYGSVEEAIQREKQIKRWNRAKKDFLVNRMNPEWKDLFEDGNASDPSTAPVVANATTGFARDDSFFNRFEKKLEELKNKNRLRTLSLPGGIDLTSNDYLGFRNHPVLRQAAIEALEGDMDLGAGGSRLLRGNTQAHRDLEEFAAPYFGCEKALYFSSGFAANQAIFATLPERHDVIIFDEFVHASMREAIQNSHAKSIKIPHNDLNAFEDALKRARDDAEMIWIAVESVYSMDGDLAPLEELYALARKYDAVLVVDEAHGTGVFGESGKGLSEGFSYENLITLHTCGKALGVAGGLVCGPAAIIDTLINRARGFIYSTAPMPLQAYLVHKALELAQAEPGRRQRLFELRDHANQLLGTESPSQIIPVIIGTDAQALSVAAALQKAGFDVRAIRPPTVPEGTARLRVSLNCNLTEKILDDFAAVLVPLLRKEAA